MGINAKSNRKATNKPRKSKSRYDAPCIKVWMFKPDELVVVGVDTNHGRDEHVSWRQRSLDIAARRRGLWSEEMAEEIALVGVKTAIRVRRELLVDQDGSEYHAPVVVAGVRRVLHARRAVEIRRAAGNLVELRLEASEVKGDDLLVLAVAYHENRHRVDDDPVAAARHLQTAVNIAGSLADACVALGMRPRQVRESLKLLRLTPKVQQMVRRGAISPAAGRTLASVEEPTRQLEVARDAAREGGTSRAAERAVADRTGGDAPVRRRGARELRKALGRLPPDSGVAAGIRFSLGEDVDLSAHVA